MEMSEFQYYLLKSLKNEKKSFPSVTGHTKNHNPLPKEPNTMYPRIMFLSDSYFMFSRRKIKAKKEKRYY